MNRQTNGIFIWYMLYFASVYNEYTIMVYCILPVFTMNTLSWYTLRYRIPDLFWTLDVSLSFAWRVAAGILGVSVSQCSTLERNTVVRAINTSQWEIGKFDPPEGPKPLNRLRWNCTWLITSPTLPHMHNLVNAHNGFRGTVGVKLSHRCAFFMYRYNEYFCSSFSLCPAYPKNAGLALNASKSVFWW